MPEYVIRIEDATSQRSNSPVTGASANNQNATAKEAQERFKKE